MPITVRHSAPGAAAVGSFLGGRGKFLQYLDQLRQRERQDVRQAQTSLARTAMSQQGALARQQVSGRQDLMQRGLMEQARMRRQQMGQQFEAQQKELQRQAAFEQAEQQHKFNLKYNLQRSGLRVKEATIDAVVDEYMKDPLEHYQPLLAQGYAFSQQDRAQIEKIRKGKRDTLMQLQSENLSPMSALADFQKKNAILSSVGRPERQKTLSDMIQEENVPGLGKVPVFYNPRTGTPEIFGGREGLEKAYESQIQSNPAAAAVRDYKELPSGVQTKMMQDPATRAQYKYEIRQRYNLNPENTPDDLRIQPREREAFINQQTINAYKTLSESIQDMRSPEVQAGPNIEEVQARESAFVAVRDIITRHGMDPAKLKQIPSKGEDGRPIVINGKTLTLWDQIYGYMDRHPILKYMIGNAAEIPLN